MIRVNEMSVQQNHHREIEWQVFLDRINDRKQLAENTIMHLQPMQLSQIRGDVILFSVPHNDHSSWVLDNLLISMCGRPTRNENTEHVHSRT